LSDEFDIRVLTPDSAEIELPFQVFTCLKKLHLLERDRTTGKRRIQARVFGLMALWNGPDFKPDRDFQTLIPDIGRAGHGIAEVVD
jgi:hypothetical protein